MLQLLSKIMNLSLGEILYLFNIIIKKFSKIECLILYADMINSIQPNY